MKQHVCSFTDIPYHGVFADSECERCYPDFSKPRPYLAHRTGNGWATSDWKHQDHGKLGTVTIDGIVFCDWCGYQVENVPLCSHGKPEPHRLTYSERGDAGSKFCPGPEHIA